MPNTRADSSHWRTALLEVALYVLAAISLALCWVVQTFPVRAPWLLATLSGVSAAAVLAIVMRGLGYYTRTLVVMFGVHIVCASPLLHGAIATPNTSAGFLLEAVLATLLLGRRAGFVVIAGAVASFGLAWAIHQGAPPPRPLGWERGFDTTHADVALRVSFVACVISFAAVLGISYLLQRLEQAVAERDASLARLAEEHEARLRVMQELDQREAAFLRARELEVLGRMSSFVAHDFNNALLAIFGGNDLARHARSDRERDDALAIIQSAAMQAASTVKQLRAFGPRSVRPQMQLLDPGQVARSAERLLRTLLPQNIELHVHTEPTARIRADEGLMQSALMNLSLNAWDAMREGGRLEIRVRAAESGARGVLVEVQDSGVGMDEATVARVFASFFTTKGAAGSGLGLASVRQTVEADGGEVSVRSALGAGTCVQLRWPAADTDEHALISSSVSTVPPPLHGGSVLVVDDDSAVRATVATFLRRRGLTAFEAATRDEALQLTAHRRVDVVVTGGVVAGGESAVSFVRQLRESSPGLRILLCTGCDPDDFEAARALVDGALPKPFELATLMAQLEALMQPSASAVQVA